MQISAIETYHTYKNKVEVFQDNDSMSLLLDLAKNRSVKISSIQRDFGNSCVLLKQASLVVVHHGKAKLSEEGRDFLKMFECNIKEDEHQAFGFFPVHVGTLSPQELFRRCAAIPPDESAWKEFDKRYALGLMAGICRVIGYPPNAIYHELFPDMLEKVFIRLLNHGRRLLVAFRGRSESEAQVYLRRIATSVVLNEVRRRRLAVPLPVDSLPKQSGEGERMQYLPSRKGFDKVLERWMRGRHKYRNILAFKMHVYEGCSAAEIADVLGMGVTARAVENLISRMRRKLQETRGQTE